MRVAVFTMVYNESVFLPIWYNYYSVQVGRDNTYILDHGSTDGSTKLFGNNIVRLPRGPLDEIDRARAVANFNNLLLKYYDAVVFCDADEIIVPDPEIYPNLHSYLLNNTKNVIAPAGLALLHIPGVEQPISFSRPLLAQRSWARFQALYAKPVITRIPVDWSPGFHSVVNASYSIESDIYLFHLKAMDYEIAHSELRKRHNIILSDRANNLNHDAQFKLQSKEFDDVYFFTTAKDLACCAIFEVRGAPDIRDQKDEILVDLKSSFGKLVRIPERFQNVIPLKRSLQTSGRYFLARLFNSW